ncbi:hypothetical protein [Crocinitomix algicola]|uniref:hypothetical protein n=1 Tax=Crocinitomix algicola TaxID=1740263 RepID=UPI0008720362|nr:hypothetical protein [Crocinitomix algicola]
MFKIFLLIISILNGVTLHAQISRGNIADYGNVIDLYYVNDSLNLSKLRATANFLTDKSCNFLNGNKLPKRKKAFIRHVQFLTEAIEESYFKGKELSPFQRDCLYELHFYYLAFRAASARKFNRVNFFDKLRMLYNTYKHCSGRKVKITDGIEQVIHSDSPFWHSFTEVRPVDRFDYIAKQKKIKVHKKMVVLMDKIGTDGSAPKVRVSDLDLDNEWNLKWGDEVHTDVVGSRIFSALGYDVDHPYAFLKDQVYLVFDEYSQVKSLEALKVKLKDQYGFNLEPFVSSYGVVNVEMTDSIQSLRSFEGLFYCTFKKCALEARPDRVKRIGPFMLEGIELEENALLRGALLAHAFIDNWDTRSRNTLLSTVHKGKHRYRVSAVFSDLGTSLGVSVSPINGDFKVGLVNQLAWEVCERKGNKIRVMSRMNAEPIPYKQADYHDLFFVAKQIEKIDSIALRNIVLAANWPFPVAELYFHKLAARRASILQSFLIEDENPIYFNRHISIKENNEWIVKDGVLLVNYNGEDHPEGWISKKGRFRNYGH